MSITSTGLSDDEAKTDTVWGAENIGKEIARSAQQVYYLYRIGALDGAVTKLGPKTFVASRRKLQTLPLSKIGK
jgi:hypothetical protein